MISSSQLMQADFSKVPLLGCAWGQVPKLNPSVKLSQAKGNTVTQQQGFH